MFVHYLLDPHGAFAACARKYGDPFFLPLAGGGTVVTGDPEGIRAIMGSDPDNFVSYRTDATEAILGPHSLFFQSGSRHRAARRILGVPFHGARMRRLGARIEASTRAQLGALASGEPFSLQRLAQRIALDVIVPAIFGVTDEERVAVYHRVIFSGFDRVGPAVLNFKWLRRPFGGLGPWARVQRMVNDLNRLTAEEIAARRARPTPSDEDDVLGGLLRGHYDDGAPIHDDDIRDKLFDMVIAGYETSAIAIAWAGYEIFRDPSVHARLVSELDGLGPDPDFEGLMRLPYLNDVCQEVLRLHPVFALLTRRLARPLTMKGFELPAGVGVSAAIGSVHLRDDVYPDPRVFRPERFRARAFSPFEYLPYGGGAQRCVGAAFASYQMKIILATLLRHTRLRLMADGPVRAVARAATVAPWGGVEVAIAERRDQRSMVMSS